MDWLKGMNDVVIHIEENLLHPICNADLSRIVGCSVYEFSRIFSFMAGMSVSEYIRRRRLSQAAFDIQSGGKVIDIALKYCYESPTSFTRAFKELHGISPSQARKEGVPLKTYPPITFVLTIKGVNEMNFRIEKKDSFQIMGLAGTDNLDCNTWGNDTLPPLWRKFMDEYHPRLQNAGGKSFYSMPFEQVAAYDFGNDQNSTNIIIGAQYHGTKPDGMTTKTIPAATWAVFTITSPTGAPYVPEAWTRVITEWFPASGYLRDEEVPSMEVFPDGNASSKDYQWEIWMPVKNL
ncbi:MAG: AraC family transcriptional regulator [Defluviitaleaceae bacterium]|nr:AraC family transcriptional regulator [Defluviitaleaceae bacterium]